MPLSLDDIEDIELSNGTADVQPQLVGMATEGSFGAETRRGSCTRRLTDEESDDDLLEQEALTHDELKWCLALVLVCGLDLVGSACLAVVSFSYAFRDDGVSLYCLGIQALSHLTTSLALAIRFMGDMLPAREAQLGINEVSEASLLLERRRRDLKREQALSVFMGIAMLMSSCALLFKAVRKIKFWDVWYLDHVGTDHELEVVTDFLAWSGFGGYVLQAVLRLTVAWKVRRSIVWHGFAVSTVSLLFLLALAVAASYEREWSWKAEPIAAIGLVIVTLCEGIRMILLHLHDVDTHLRHERRA